MMKKLLTITATAALLSAPLVSFATNTGEPNAQGAKGYQSQENSLTQSNSQSWDNNQQGYNQGRDSSMSNTNPQWSGESRMGAGVQTDINGQRQTNPTGEPFSASPTEAPNPAYSHEYAPNIGSDVNTYRR